MNILFEIAGAKRRRVERLKNETGLERLKKEAAASPACRDFRKAISNPSRTNIIAEVKRASPSAGIISEDFDPAYQAKAYENAGAAAISVLTEEDYFKGSLDNLKTVKEAISLPVLRKDFVIDEYQVYESKVCGADAILLIAALLDTEKILEFMTLSSALGMASLLEIHNQSELEKVGKLPFEIIGINNRDLSSFKVDLDAGAGLAGQVEKGKTIVIESGIKTASDVAMFKQRGISAFLIGETLMRSTDISKTMKELTSV